MKRVLEQLREPGQPAPGPETARVEVGRRAVADHGWHGGGPPDGPPDLDFSYWQQVEPCHALWAGHIGRWPGALDRSRRDHSRPGDPPGSWRGQGDRYLSPDQNAAVGPLVAALRSPEGAVTAALLQIQQENPYGGRLEGLDHRLKGITRLKEKIADALDKELGSNVADASRGIYDAVRYTFSFPGDRYADGCDLCRRVESAGYVMVEGGRNHWRDDPDYKGINTRWCTPDGGRFELQFHTFESFHAKDQLTHRSYSRLRSPDTSWQEMAELTAYQRVVSGAIPKPSGAEHIAW